MSENIEPSLNDDIFFALATYAEIAAGGAIAGGAALIAIVARPQNQCPVLDEFDNPITDEDDVNITVDCEFGALSSGTGLDRLSIGVYGGAVSGGTSTVSLDYVARGGAVSSGEANIYLAYVARGGSVSSGDAITTVIRNITGSGSASISGDSAVSEITIVAIDGGLISGGDTLLQYIATPFNYCVITSEEEEITSGGDDVYAKCYYGVLVGSGEIPSINASGGATVGGETVSDSLIIFRGGIVAGGQAIVSISFIGKGGVTVGGGVSDFIAGSGGVAIGGESFDRLSIGVYGGSRVGGQAPMSVVYAPPDIRPLLGIIVGGEAYLGRRFYADVDGGVVVIGEARALPWYIINTDGKSSDAPPDYAGISIGYRNAENPSIVNYSFDLEFDVSWSTDRAVTVDYDVSWSTGTLPLYNYRILGRTRPTEECPLEECCQQFVVNIAARTITDLCERLKKRYGRWRVLEVRRFLRPAESTNVTPENANCNGLETEEVVICNNVVCQDYCVDGDFTQRIGFYMKAQINAFFNYESEGLVGLSGEAVTSYDHDGFKYFHQGSGEITISGEGRAFNSNIIPEGGVLVGGKTNPLRDDAADSSSSSWYFVGGEWPYSNLQLPTQSDQFVGDVSDRLWQNLNEVLIDDEVGASADISNGVPTRFLVAKNFRFHIPQDVKIVGFEVSVTRQASAAARDNAVYLISGNEILSDNMASPLAWPIGSNVTKTYGGIGMIWRDPEDPNYLGDWNIEDINNPEFGVAIRVEPSIGQSVSEVYIDSIDMKVYWENENPHVNIGGEAGVLTSDYRYNSQGVVFVGGDAGMPKIGYRFQDVGRGDMGPGFAGATISGSYGLSLRYETDGLIEIGGIADVNGYGVNASGEARVESSRYFYESGGDLTLESANNERTRWRYHADGGLAMSGIAGFNDTFRWIGSGSISLDSDSTSKSTAYNFVADGNAIFAFGSADTNFSDFGTLETIIGFQSFISDVRISFREDTDVPVDETPTDLVDKCGCTGMRLLMPMRHNMVRQNKFNQFLSKNNLPFDDLIYLKWSRINDAWVYHQTLTGVGASSLDREMWTIIYQLQCVNFVGGQLLDSRIWRFSTQIVQKNLTTFADYDTRLIVGFTPDMVCTNAGFEVAINVDTANDYSYLTPDTVVYEYKLHDNIGLFKNKYWSENPILTLQLSQIGLDQVLDRYPLVID